jgi:ubiquinol-cytochrome c reductase iron-sulfur subunit
MATVKKTNGTAKSGVKPAAVKKPTVSAKSAPAVVTNGVDDGHSEAGGVRRRDFINIAAVSFAGVGVIPIVGTLLGQMSASADVLAMASIEVDISSIETGQAIKTSWRKQPVFIRNLTKAEIDAANKVDVKSLRDPQSLADRTKPGKENWMISMGVCTHLGCVPLGAAEGEVRGEFGGYFCPCHGSHYDTAARIRKGPAPLNLKVPEYSFLTDTTLKIG